LLALAFIGFFVGSKVRCGGGERGGEEAFFFFLFVLSRLHMINKTYATNIANNIKNE
jgi:hypothetical protein